MFELDGKWTAIFAVGGSAMTFLFGAFDLPLQILCVAVVLDYFSGMLKAFYLGEVSSKVGYKGLIKKVGIFFVIVVAQLIDHTLGLAVLRNATCIAYAINEMTSISENMASIDVYVPAFIKNNLAQIKETVENVVLEKGKKK